MSFLSEANGQFAIIDIDSYRLVQGDISATSSGKYIEVRYGSSFDIHIKYSLSLPSDSIIGFCKAKDYLVLAIRHWYVVAVQAIPLSLEDFSGLIAFNCDRSPVYCGAAVKILISNPVIAVRAIEIASPADIDEQRFEC